MGKQRKSTSDKCKNWKFPFSKSVGGGGGSSTCGESGGGGGNGENGCKTTLIPSRLSRNNRFEGTLPPSIITTGVGSKAKKVSRLTSKCHAVGIGNGPVQVPPSPEPSTSSSLSIQEDKDNATYAQIEECRLPPEEIGHHHQQISGGGGPTASSHPPLKPLYFEVPQEEEHQLVERSWIYETINEILSSNRSTRGIIIHGSPGTGKTTLALQLVENSCFGRNKMDEVNPHKSPLVTLASKIVAYHFCQVDNRTTCLISDFVHSVAAQMCQAPGLTSYRTYLEDNPEIQDLLSTENCLINPKQAFTSGILEPLILLHKQRTLNPDYYFLLILDSIDEAESHRGNYGDTIASFLSKHILKIPSWFKIICTIRTNQAALLDFIPFKRISLDNMDHDVSTDVRQYIAQRLQTLQKIVTGKKCNRIDPTILPGLKTHLLQLSGGSFLFLKLTIDLIQYGHLVIKPNNFKILPVSLHEVFQLHCNLRFSTCPLFHGVTPILSTCLVALNPLNLLEIYHSVNSLRFKDNLAWVEFLRLFKSVQGLLVKRLDSTYMFFHSSFRDWLLGKDHSKGNSRFQCSSEMGHTAIVLRLLRVEPRPLNPSKLMDLVHHLLKAKSLLLQSSCSSSILSILLLSSCDNISSALSISSTINNTLCTSNSQVSRLLHLLSGAYPTTTPTTTPPFLPAKSPLQISMDQGKLHF